jgi:ADP-heptose:LPS heptosyltransferase
LPIGLANSDKLTASVRRGDVILNDWVDKESSWDVGSCIDFHKVRKVVISRDYALGDVLFVTAFIKNLITTYPHLSIYFKTNDVVSSILNGNNDFVTIVKKSDITEAMRSCDIHVCLNDVMEQYEDSHKPVDKPRIEILSTFCNVSYEQKTPRLFLDKQQIDSWLPFLSQYPRPFVGVCTSSIRKEKALSPSLWNYVCSKLTQGTLFVIDKLDIGIRGKNVIPVIDNRLDGILGLLISMDRVITLDSFLCHASSAFDIPQTLVTSCTNGKLLARDYANVDVIEPEKDCYPCWYNLKLGGCGLANYPKCLDENVADRIIKSVKENL